MIRKFVIVGSFVLSGLSYAAESCSVNAQPIVEDYTLPNGLHVVLIEDEDVEEAAAAVSAHVGCWDDPEEAPGMAHFVEHVLFMGTRDYPHEAQFHNFIHDRGGETNAFTFYDRTVFGFAIDVEHFEDATVHLGDFFVKPLFKDESLKREAHAVHHEFLDQADDFFIHLWRILKQCGNPTHPNARLSVGNLTTLNPASSEVVQRWFEGHYSADNMQAVLIAPLPMKTLRNIAEKSFGQIPVRPHTSTTSSGKLFEPMEGSVVYFNPPDDTRSLWIIWEMPTDFETYFPLSVLAETIQVPMQTGLGAILRRDNLAYDFQADLLNVDNGHCLFLLSAELTKEGLKQYDVVVQKIFAGLQQCKASGFNPSWVQNMVDREKNRLLYQTPSDPFDFALESAGDWPLEQEHPFAAENACDPFVDFLAIYSLLDPSRAIYAVSSPVDESPFVAGSMERWLGSPFIARKIMEEKIEEYRSVKPLKELSLPLTFCGYDTMRVYGSSTCGSDLDNDPIVLEQGSSTIVQFEQVMFEDQCPPLSILALWEDPLLLESLQNQVMGEVQGNFLQEKVLPNLRLKCPIAINFSSDTRDWFLEVHYFDNVDYSHLPRIFRTVQNSVATEAEWQAALLRTMELEKQRDSSFDQAIDLGYAFWNNRPLSDLDRSQVLASLTYADYLDFCDRAFKNGELSVDFIGCEDEGDVHSLWKKIASSIVLPINDDEDSLKPEEAFAFQSEAKMAVQSKSISHSAAFAFKAEWEPMEGEFFEHVLGRMVRTEAFHVLRTQKQLAYALFSDVEYYDKEMHFLVALRSGMYHPEALSKEIHLFMADFFNNPTKHISEERFKSIWDSVLSYYRPRSGKKGRNFLYAYTYEDFCNFIQSLAPSVESNSIELQVRGRAF